MKVAAAWLILARYSEVKYNKSSQNLVLIHLRLCCDALEEGGIKNPETGALFCRFQNLDVAQLQKRLGSLNLWTSCPFHTIKSSPSDSSSNHPLKLRLKFFSPATLNSLTPRCRNQSDQRLWRWRKQIKRQENGKRVYSQRYARGSILTIMYTPLVCAGS